MSGISRIIKSVSVAALVGGALVVTASHANADTSTLTISGSSSITYGASGVVAAHLTNESGGPIANGVMQLWVRPVHSVTEREVVATKTNSSGVVSERVSPHVNVVYHWIYVLFDTEGAIAEQRSAGFLMNVAQHVTVGTSTTQLATHTSPITLFGVVTPNETGQSVQLEYRASSTASWIKSTQTAVLKWQALPDGTTRVGYVLRFNIQANQFRVYRAPTSLNAGGASAAVQVVLDK